MPYTLVVERVLGVLNGRDMNLSTLAKWLGSADRVYAADGGGRRAQEAGVEPHVVVGDFDSSEPSTFAEWYRVDDQESTDCDKLLAHVLKDGFQALTLVGVEGDRLDHVLASLASAARSPLQVSLGLRTGWGRVLVGPTSLDLPGCEGATVSLMPLEKVSGVSLTGVQWPFSDRTLSPSGFVSISNRAVGEIRAVVTQGAALLTVSSDGEPVWR